MCNRVIDLRACVRRTHAPAAGIRPVARVEETRLHIDDHDDTLCLYRAPDKPCRTSAVYINRDNKRERNFTFLC